MKNMLILVVWVYFSLQGISQVGINQPNPHTSSALDIAATNKGLLIPRMTLGQGAAILDPATGLIIYLTNVVPGFYYYNGTAWKKIDQVTSLLSDGDGDTQVNAEKNSNEDKIRFTLGGSENMVFENAGSSFRMAAKSGLGNVWLGLNAGADNLIGRQNVALGDSCLANVNASFNTAIGFRTLGLLTTGTANTGAGIYALSSSVAGSGSTAIGHYALSKYTANYSTAVGLGALRNMTAGVLNTAIGSLSMEQATGGSQNTAIGFSALRYNSTGTGNTALGYQALLRNTSGSRNTAVGSKALKENTLGIDNTAIGYLTLSSNLDGDFNTAIGYSALEKQTTGNSNTAIGVFALKNLISGSNNTAIGKSSLGITTGSSGNTALGSAALFNTTDGHQNTAMGYEALYSNTIGDNNTAIGYQALYNNTTGSNNTGIGSFTRLGTSALSNATAIGSRAQVDQSNTLILGGIVGVNGATEDATLLINKNTIDPSVIVDMHTTGKGILMPRMTNAQRNAIATPAAGLMVYSTTSHSPWIYNGNVWENFNDPLSAMNADIGEGIIYKYDGTINNDLIPGFSTAIVDADGDSRAEVDYSTGGFEDYSSFRVKLRDTIAFELKTVSPYFGSTSINIQNKFESIFFGENSGQNIQDGLFNNGIGFAALRDLQMGERNVAVGSNALASLLEGSNNVAVGKSAMASDLYSGFNVGMGMNALAGSGGDYNVALGYASLDGSNFNNTCLGAFTKSTGETCTAIGARAEVGVNAPVFQFDKMILGAIDGVNGATANTKVGIGTTAPDAMLHLKTNANQEPVSGLMVEDSFSNSTEIEFANGNQVNWIVRGKTSSGPQLSFLHGSLGNNPLNVMQLSSTGNLTIAGNLQQNSDRRLKKDIRVLNGSLEKIRRIHGYTYYWKDKGQDNTLQYGVLAQEVEKVFPNLVSKHGKYKTVNYAGLTSVMVNAVNELEVKLQAQKRVLDENDRLIQELEAMLEER
ncbi:MAG: tail fiber domain-containing protein [Saprospiraceae bacterium]|nr:tail fiber domain-containing protein [Saprospiraceae bacterium]